MAEIQDAAATQIITAVVEILETMEIMVSLVDQEIVVEDIYSYQLSYSYVMVASDVVTISDLAVTISHLVVT